MRALVFLLAAASLAAAQDLRPRQGSGWAGFGTGSWVKVRRTTAVRGAEPLVTRWTSRLTKAGHDSLTLETTIKTALGIEQKQTHPLPARGEAGQGETQRVEKLDDETIEAAGRSFACARRRTTVTGPQGKRVITDWTAKKPLVRVKRTVVVRDGAGREVSRLSMILRSLDQRRTLGTQTVRCLEYATVRTQGAREEKGKMVSSRDVPGGTVLIDTVTREKGQPVMAMRIEAVEFEAR